MQINIILTVFSLQFWIPEITLHNNKRDSEKHLRTDQALPSTYIYIDNILYIYINILVYIGISYKRIKVQRIVICSRHSLILEHQ